MKNLIFQSTVVFISLTSMSFAAGHDSREYKYPINSNEVISSPVSIIKEESKRSIEEIITENSRIIEADQPGVDILTDLDQINYIISEDNKIIEGEITKEIYPLNFELINKNLLNYKVNNARARLVGAL